MFGVVIKRVYLGTEVAIKKIKMDEDMKLKTHLEVQIMRLACTKEKGQTKYKAHKQKTTSASEHHYTHGHQQQ